MVTTLWRSNLAEIMHADSDGGATHRCLLTISFSCGAVLTADQGLVYQMASAHRAAPSEHQILGVLQQAALAHQRSQGPQETAMEDQGAASSLKIVATSGSGKSISKLILAEHQGHTNHIFLVQLQVGLGGDVLGQGEEEEGQGVSTSEVLSLLLFIIVIYCYLLLIIFFILFSSQVLDLAAAAYSFQCKCAEAGPEQGGEGSVEGVGAEKRGGEGQGGSVVIALM